MIKGIRVFFDVALAACWALLHYLTILTSLISTSPGRQGSVSPNNRRGAISTVALAQNSVSCPQGAETHRHAAGPRALGSRAPHVSAGARCAATWGPGRPTRASQRRAGGEVARAAAEARTSRASGLRDPPAGLGVPPSSRPRSQALASRVLGRRDMWSRSGMHVPAARRARKQPVRARQVGSEESMRGKQHTDQLPLNHAVPLTPKTFSLRPGPQHAHIG